MERHGRRWIVLFPVLLFALAAAAQDPAPVPADQPADREARLTSVSGAVYVHLRDQDEGEFVAAKPDSTIEDGDMIRTGDDGEAELTLDGASVILVGANSDFLVNSLACERTEFHIGIGSVVAKIKRLLEGQNMEFRTQTAVASVRGTELAVAQETGDKVAHIGVMDEGRVAVSMPGRPDTAQLGPGQEIEATRGRPLGRPTALARFAGVHSRMDQLRARVARASQDWRPRDAAARAQARGALRSGPVLRSGQLNHVRADIQARRYPAEKIRQDSLRKSHQQNLQRRQAGANKRAHVRPRRQNNQPQQQERQRQMQERRQQAQRQREQQQERRQELQRQREQQQERRQQRRRPQQGQDREKRERRGR